MGTEDRQRRAMPSRAIPACQKCGGRLCFYERSGVIVEQCEDCRGIFLDQGELERLIEAEGGGWSGVIREPSLLGPHRVSTRQDLAAAAPARVRGEPISARRPGPGPLERACDPS